MDKFYKCKSERKDENFPVKLNDLRANHTSKNKFLDVCQNNAVKSIKDANSKTCDQTAQSGKLF